MKLGSLRRSAHLDSAKSSSGDFCGSPTGQPTAWAESGHTSSFKTQKTFVLSTFKEAFDYMNKMRTHNSLVTSISHVRHFRHTSLGIMIQYWNICRKAVHIKTNIIIT